MSKKWKPSSPWLRRKVKQGFRGYPIATVAFYGPTADLATKVVVAIVRDEGREPDPLERWFSEDSDVRSDLEVGTKVLAFLKEHAAKSVVVTDGLIGCPHEEGIDYRGKVLRAVSLLGWSRPLHSRAHPVTSWRAALLSILNRVSLFSASSRIGTKVAVQHPTWGHVDLLPKIRAEMYMTFAGRIDGWRNDRFVRAAES